MDDGEAVAMAMDGARESGGKHVNAGKGLVRGRRRPCDLRPAAISLLLPPAPAPPAPPPPAAALHVPHHTRPLGEDPPLCLLPPDGRYVARPISFVFDSTLSQCPSSKWSSSDRTRVREPSSGRASSSLVRLACRLFDCVCVNRLCARRRGTPGSPRAPCKGA